MDGCDLMTYKCTSFHTSRTEKPNIYTVSFCGDNRFYSKLEVHCSVDFGPDALDYIELFGIWFYICELEVSGQARTAKNLKLVVSRGAIKRLLREESSKSHLFQFTNALRTQLFGLNDVSVDKDGSWSVDLPAAISVIWDGSIPDYPVVHNPKFGKIRITMHALTRYFDHTGREGRADGVFQKVSKLVRDADVELKLPERVLRRKEVLYGLEQRGALYIKADANWNLVIVRGTDGYVLKTVYQRSDDE